jgi:hypothetical protein
MLEIRDEIDRGPGDASRGLEDHRTGAAWCARRANLNCDDAKRTQALFTVCAVPKCECRLIGALLLH